VGVAQGFAPKEPQQISPGQGDASSTSAAAALGVVSRTPIALKGRNKSHVVCVLCCPFRAIGVCGSVNPGRRYAANTAPLCPGLICLAPFGANGSRHTESVRVRNSEALDSMILDLFRTLVRDRFILAQNGQDSWLFHLWFRLDRVMISIFGLRGFRSAVVWVAAEGRVVIEPARTPFFWVTSPFSASFRLELFGRNSRHGVAVDNTTGGSGYPAPWLVGQGRPETAHTFRIRQSTERQKACHGSGALCVVNVAPREPGTFGVSRLEQGAVGVPCPLPTESFASGLSREQQRR